jgi:UDP-N-acetylmuramate--alanine ligase
LGGIALNYGTNLLLSEKSRLMVAEADEYDRSFHQLSPWMAAITSVDPDHLDIYHSHEAYLEAFAHFTSLIRPGGVLLMKQALVLQPILAEGVRQYTYATEQMPYGRSADFYAENIVIEEGRLYFDFNYPGGRIKKMELGLPIMIHVENALAAMGLAYLSGVSPGELRAALVSFKGNQRRFDFQIRRDDFVYIDDYAHHPDELKASIRSLKALYPGKELTGIFQPHLYSRTRDFAGEFAKALSGLDYVYLLDIYPAREEAIPRVDSRLIFDKLTSRGKILCSMDEILSLLDRKKPEVLVTLGAGNIDRLVPLLKEKYS